MGDCEFCDDPPPWLDERCRCRRLADERLAAAEARIATLVALLGEACDFLAIEHRLCKLNSDPVEFLGDLVKRIDAALKEPGA